jgi:hypothetical protein
MSENGSLVVTRYRAKAAGVAFGSSLVLCASGAAAQSVVVSVPSTDVTKRGVVMVAHESQVNAWSSNKPYWNSFSFATYGLGRQLELAATLYGVGRPAGKVALALGYKHRVPLAAGSSWEPTLAFGPMVPVSLSGDGVGIWAYGAASIRLPQLRTRLTAGPSYGTKQIFGDTTLCVFGAIEQPITPSFYLIVD